MNGWGSGRLIECLGWTLVHFVWQGFVIAALLAGFLRMAVGASSIRRYWAGCAALLLLALAPVFTFQIVSSHIPVEPIAQIETLPEMEPDAKSVLPDAAPKTKIVVAAHHEKAQLNFSQRLESFFPWLVLGWSIGVFALSCRLLGGWLHVQRLKRNPAGMLDPIWRNKLAELSRRLGITRSVQLMQSALVEVPTVLGWLRPVILLPASCLTGLSRAQLEAILAHELAHIRRHDYLVNLLQSVVETVLFYHPAVWWVSHQVRAERENCCDDLAVEVCGDRVGYARALATLEELRLAPAQLALAAGGPPLLPRIRRLAGQSAANANRPAWPMAGVITLLMIAALAVSLRGNRADAKDQPLRQPEITPDVLGLDAVEPDVEGLKTVTESGRAAQKQAEEIQKMVASENPPAQDTKNIISKPMLVAQARPVNTGIGRRGIFSKLDSIRIDSIAFDHTPFSEVINQLAEIAKSSDPENKGINFFIDQGYPTPTPAAATDPATGRLLATPPPDLNITNVTITIAPAMRNLRLADVLDAVKRGADYPIAFSVLDYAIVFRLKDVNEPHELELRTFHVDPNTFQQGLQGVTGAPFGSTSSGESGNGNAQGAGAIIPRVDITSGVDGVTTGAGNQNGRGPSSASIVENAANPQNQIRQFFATAGVDLDTNHAGNVGKMFVWKDRGILMVRSTSKDLDAVQAALDKINLAKSKDANQIQGNAVLRTNNKPARARRETSGLGAASLNRSVTPQINIKVEFVEMDASKKISVRDQEMATEVPGLLDLTNLPPSRNVPLEWMNLTNTLGRVTNSIIAISTNILTHAQYVKWMDALKQQDGVDILSTPQVTTETGRQCQMQVATMQTIVTGLNTTHDKDGKAKDTYQTQSFPFGPTVDVIPFVSADGKSVELTTIASITEFLGYIDPKAAPEDAPKAAPDSKGVIPLPHFRVRQLTTEASVKDGDTIVLGGVGAECLVTHKDKVPVLGDIPLVGRLFRSTSTVKTRKRLLVFITPTLINADGTRYHTAENAANN